MIFPSILNDREKHELPRAIYRSRHMVLSMVMSMSMVMSIKGDRPVCKYYV